MLTLHNFEDYIEAKIIDRGFEYYEYDQVLEVEQLTKGHFSALVQGTEEYEVNIELAHSQIIFDHSCSCPYDWGEYCKHEVAVLYYIRDSELYLETESNSSFQKLEQKVKQLSKTDLERMVLEMAKKSKSFRNELYEDWEIE